MTKLLETGHERIRETVFLVRRLLVRREATENFEEPLTALLYQSTVPAYDQTRFALVEADRSALHLYCSLGSRSAQDREALSDCNATQIARALCLGQIRTSRRWAASHDTEPMLSCGQPSPSVRLAAALPERAKSHDCEKEASASVLFALGVCHWRARVFDDVFSRHFATQASPFSASVPELPCRSLDLAFSRQSVAIGKGRLCGGQAVCWSEPHHPRRQ